MQVRLKLGSIDKVHSEDSFVYEYLKTKKKKEINIQVKVQQLLYVFPKHCIYFFAQQGSQSLVASTFTLLTHLHPKQADKIEIHGEARPDETHLVQRERRTNASADSSDWPSRPPNLSKSSLSLKTVAFNTWDTS